MRAIGIVVTAAAMVFAVATNAQGIDWKKVDDALGRPGAVSGDVHRYGFPRSDLHVTLDGVAIKPALALGGWVAFKPDHDGVMMMGDVVLLENEINPVMTTAIENGLEITAVHNHILRAAPLTFYMHVSAHGDAVQLANALHKTLAASQTPLAVATSTAAPAVALNTAELDRIIGVQGNAVGGVYQFGVPRRDQIIQNGMPLVPAGPLGVATGINFQPTGDGKAAITGDFVLAAEEVNPVIRALRTNGIEVTALHSHMLDEQPRLFFMHFWANDDATKLAKGVRAALDLTSVSIAQDEQGTGSGPKAQSARVGTASGPSETFKGEVATVDEASGKISVKLSGTVGANNATTPTYFKIQDALVFNSIKPGDKVSFTAERKGGEMTITKLTRE